MADKKEENKSTTYPSVEEKIKMQMEKEKTHYTKFENYLYKNKVLPNGLTVEEQQMENIKNRSWEKKFSIRKNIFRKFDAWLDKKAQEAIEEAEKTDPFSQTGMGNGKADFWMGFTGQRQSRYSQDSLAGAFVRGSLNFLEGVLEAPFMLEDPDVFMEELANTPKAFGQMKEEIESGNQNIMGIMATEASWGVAMAALGAAAKRNAAIERSNAQMTDDVVELTEQMNKCSPDRSCFLAGTLVETKTGKKAIEEIEEGEEVWCEEECTKEQKLKKVLKRIEKTNDILYHVYIGNQEIHTTEDHAIWLEGEGWKKAEDVHVGDIVRCRTGEPEKVTNVWMEKLSEQVKVYNLSVEDVHNYYVSERDVLVHNDCPRNNKVNIESGGRVNFKWGNPNSLPTYGHTFSMKKHSAKIKPLQLIERAKRKGHQIGKWLDNQIAANFLAEIAKKGPGVHSVNLPDGVKGVSYLPDGTALVPDKAIVIVKDNGGILTAYPYNSGYPINNL